MKMLLRIQQDQYTCKCLTIKDKEEELEIKSGQLYMIQTVNNKLRRMPVFVRVYRNRFEHYVVIYRNQTFANKSVFVTLKDCHVEVCDKSNNEIRVTSGKMESTKVTFQAKNVAEVEEWLSVLTPSNNRGPGPLSMLKSLNIPRTPLMPKLEENEEESD